MMLVAGEELDHALQMLQTTTPESNYLLWMEQDREKHGKLRVDLYKGDCGGGTHNEPLMGKRAVKSSSVSGSTA
jgi:hypothetical protein